MPGVRAVISGNHTRRRPGLALSAGGAQGHLEQAFDPLCRYEGEAVAAVAAETPYQAWDAVRAIKVKYEVLALHGGRAKGP